MLRYWMDLRLNQSVNKNLQNQHEIINIRQFHSGPALLKMEYSIGVRGFRQNHCTPHHYHFDKFITSGTDKILYKYLSFSIRD